MPQNAREVQLARRPSGAPVPEDFRIAEVEVPDPADDELLIRNVWMSVDPYMRGRMNDRKSYAPPFELDAPLYGGAVGEVVASRYEGIAEGDWVVHGLGWREYAVADGHAVRRIDPAIGPPQAFLGVLGMTGLTAYVGLLDIAALRDGDIVFVSGAAGAVGSLAGQLARARGHTVIGSAGSPAKVAFLRDELGFDAAFDYHDGPVAEQLAAAAPDGIDVYYDNVGGEHLEAAIGAMRMHGRVAMCGSISGYNATEPPPGPRNLALVVGRRLTLRGFLVGDHADRRQAFEAEVSALLREGRIVGRETVVEGGIEVAPQAFIALLAGANTGKMLVSLAG
jgi:NADPH-dependent curcumin reductase CurA